MSNIFISESYVNATEGYRYGDTEVYETFTDNVGRLFKSLQRDFGRCMGKVYIDSGDQTLNIGWIFQKRVQYDRSNKTYIQETWVSLHKAPPVKTIEYQYINLHEVK